MKDIEIINAINDIRNGNIEAASIIYDKTKNQTYKVLFSYTGDEQLSLDILQDTYVTLIEKIDTIKEPEALQKFINTMAINKVKNYYKKHRKENLTDENDNVFLELIEENEEFLPQEILDSKEKQKIIKEIIDELPENQKSAIYLYYFNELTLSQVAKAMECSEGTVKSRLNYARKKIKNEVDTWEKKGTKLYSTGIPVLYIILKTQIDNIQIPADEVNKLLNNILKTISGSGIIGAAIEGKKVHAAVKTGISAKKALIMKITAGITAGTVVTGVAISKIQKPEEKHGWYISYSNMQIDGKISKINLSGENLYTIYKNDDERYIEITRNERIKYGNQHSVIVDTEGKEHYVDAEISKDLSNLSYNSDPHGDNVFGDYICYKSLTDGEIKKIGDYDKNIIQITNEPDKHDVKIIPVSEGKTTVEITDNKLKKGYISVESKKIKFDDKVEYETKCYYKKCSYNFKKNKTK